MSLPASVNALDELIALVDEYPEFAGELADVTLVLGLTGLRFGELRGLRVRDVTRAPYPAVVVSRSLPQPGSDGQGHRAGIDLGGSL